MKKNNSMCHTGMELMITLLLEKKNFEKLILKNQGNKWERHHVGGIQTTGP